jgi:hypothetical protein
MVRGGARHIFSSQNCQAERRLARKKNSRRHAAGVYKPVNAVDKNVWFLPKQIYPHLWINFVRKTRFGA